MHQHFNGLKTALLLGGIFGLLLAIGGLIAGSTRNSTFIWVFALIGIGTTAYGYWNSDKLAIRAMQAYPVSEAQAPQLYRIVRELSTRAGKPMPRLYISPTQAPNAFATGRNPENAAVCCTEGILGLLDERELRGVLGHELMHVYNRDILTGSVAAAVAGVITSVAQMLMFASMFGGGGGNSDENRGNPFALLLLSLLAPFAASVIQMAISRAREFEADRGGAEICGDPHALADALARIDAYARGIPMPTAEAHPATAQMMIMNPLSGGGIASLFSTHPEDDIIEVIDSRHENFITHDLQDASHHFAINSTNGIGNALFVGGNDFSK